MLQDAQLAALGSICDLLDRQRIEYWLFGGWAVDFHAGRPSRAHDDLDLAVWAVDHSRIAGLLTSEGWAHAPEPGDDGYTGYERGGVRLELAFLERSDDGTVYTPLEDGRGAWPEGAKRRVRSDRRPARPRSLRGPALSPRPTGWPPVA